MIDPMISLSMTIHSNKGAYALLLGSGISRSAGIPTGWEIVQDFIRKIAVLEEGEDIKTEEEKWFREKFRTDPDYSDILNHIAKTPNERRSLLESYFEPSDEEKQEGKKLPTPAHKAIAELVSKGYFRVILTTNFDRLIEKALEDHGITPVVISTPESVAGMMSLSQSRCTVIKINGDYLDTRIRNIRTELEAYDETFEKLLDRLLDEYGLIICGWSAEWDIALRKAIERCPTRRYATYWTLRQQASSGETKRLIQSRKAEIIIINNADAFFSELEEKIRALEVIDKPHPMSSKIAIENVKRYLIGEEYKIRLHDLVMNETESVYKAISEQNFPLQGVSVSPTELDNRLKRYEAAVEILLSMMITGCYWGEKEHEYLWLKALKRIANVPQYRAGTVVWIHLRGYPALLLLYGAGIACVSNNRYKTLAALLTKVDVKIDENELPAVMALNYGIVIDNDFFKTLPGYERRVVPVCDYLWKTMSSKIATIVPDESDYAEAFERFEYLFSLVHADLSLERNGHLWAPWGSFVWRSRRHFGPIQENSVVRRIENEAKSMGNDWPILKTGLFQGSLERFLQVKSGFDSSWSSRSW